MASTASANAKLLIFSPEPLWETSKWLCTWAGSMATLQGTHIKLFKALFTMKPMTSREGCEQSSGGSGTVGGDTWSKTWGDWTGSVCGGGCYNGCHWMWSLKNEMTQLTSSDTVKGMAGASTTGDEASWVLQCFCIYLTLACIQGQTGHNSKPVVAFRTITWGEPDRIHFSNGRDVKWNNFHLHKTLGTVGHVCPWNAPYQLQHSYFLPHIRRGHNCALQTSGHSKLPQF